MVSNGEYGGRGNKNWFNKAAANFAKNISFAISCKLRQHLFCFVFVCLNRLGFQFENRLLHFCGK